MMALVVVWSVRVFTILRISRVVWITTKSAVPTVVVVSAAAIAIVAASVSTIAALAVTVAALVAPAALTVSACALRDIFRSRWVSAANICISCT